MDRTGNGASDGAFARPPAELAVLAYGRRFRRSATPPPVARHAGATVSGWSLECSGGEQIFLSGPDQRTETRRAVRYCPRGAHGGRPWTAGIRRQGQGVVVGPPQTRPVLLGPV